MSLEQQALIESNIKTMEALKASLHKNESKVASPNTIELIKATLEAMKIFDAHNTCFTVEECADFLGVHRTTISSKLHSGEIKGVFLGRIWTIPKLQFVDKILAEEL